MPNVALDSALHHCTSIVILDVTFPARFRQIMVLSEALLPEIFDSVIVCIGQEVVQIFRLGMVF